MYFSIFSPSSLYIALCQFDELRILCHLELFLLENPLLLCGRYKLFFHDAHKPSDSIIAIATLVLAILFLLGYDEPWLFFVIAAIRAAGQGAQTPAIGAILPQIVPQNKLTKVNGINGSIQSVVTLISPMIGGALLSIAPIQTIFFIDVITAAIAVSILLFFLKVPTHEKALRKEKISYFEDLKKGFVYINEHKFLKMFFLFFAMFFLLAGPVSFLTPLQVTRSFNGDYTELATIEVAFSIGMMLGGGLIAAWGGFRNKIHTMMLASLIFGLCTFALGVVPVFWIYTAFMGIIGIAMPLFSTPANVLLQEKVEGDYLGRVFGVLGMISTSMLPLGMLVFGPIADAIAIEWLLVGTGILLFMIGFFLVGSMVLVEAGKPAGEEV